MDDKKHQLLSRLIERTRGDSLSWAEGIRPNEFVTHFPRMSVHLRSDTSDGFELFVRDEKANYVAFMTEQDGVETAEGLDTLYKLVTERIYRREEKLDELLRELG